MSITLYHAIEQRPEPLESRLASLAADAGEQLCWAEPRPWLPRENGIPRLGRLPGFTPLGRQAPDPAIPLREARLFLPRQWHHLLAGPGPGCRQVHWSEAPFPGATEETGLLAEEQPILLWRDRARFGLAQATEEDLKSIRIRAYRRAGRLLAWRILVGESK